MLDEITAKDESTLDYLVEKSIVGRLMENSLRREERKFVEVLPCLRSDESIGCEILL